MGKSNKDNLNGRQARQKEEGYEEVKTNLPESGFQDTKQVLSADQLGGSKSDLSNAAGQNILKPETLAAKTLKGKIKVRPDAGVEQLEDKQVGGVPLVGQMNVRSVAGVSNVSMADDQSKIPYSAGNYRPQSRYGKKRSEDLFYLDNQVSEQIAPYVDDAKDLREAPDALQGYNGRKQFTAARAKKNYNYVNGNNHTVGKLPQQLLQETSVDFINTSKLLYTSGQMITGKNSTDGVSIPKGGDYPTVCNGSPVAFTMHKGNYVLKGFQITTANGKISGVKFLEDYYELHPDPITRDQANMNLQVDIHNVTKSVIKLQNELGRETTDKWSPLGYVINEPYEYNTLMHDIESSTGAIMATAYRAAVSSMSYQRNIAGKDGVNPQRNGVKMILEGYAGILSSSDVDCLKSSSFNDMIWKKSEYQKGSVAGLIAMFDTTGKYKTKADLLGLQRSLSLHLSQADNNINPLHCKKEYIKALNKAHMYSTIDGNYNPLLPIFCTKYIKIANPLSLNSFLIGWKHPSSLTAEERQDALRDEKTGTYANYAYKYSDLRSIYTTPVQHPLVEGLLTWLLEHEGAFVDTFGDNTTIYMPCHFDFQAPSLFEFILCSAAQKIAFERNISFRDVIFAGEQSTYIWDDLASLKDIDPLFSTQLKITGYNESLKLGKLSPDTAIRELWNDQMQVNKIDDGKIQYMLPWYFNEAAFGNDAGGSYTTNEGFFNEESAFNMSIPSIRDGVCHEYVDIIKSMSERDIRLALDRRIDLPVFITETAEKDSNNVDLWTKFSNYNSGTSVINSNIKLSTLRYDANSDGRMIAVYDLTSGSNRELPFNALYCCAKEIGFIDDLYYPFSVITEADYVDNAVSITATTMTFSKKIGLTSAYAYNGASPMYITSYRVFDDSSKSGSIDRSAALSQVFYNCFASIAANTADINQKYVAKTGIVPCLSYNGGAASDVYGVYNLGSNNESTHALDKTIRTIAHRIWTMIQRFFLPVNRFENIYSVDENIDYDMLETAFYFGLCGMLASDYTQDVLQRLDAYDQLGLDYTEDYFCKDSLIFRLD